MARKNTKKKPAAAADEQNGKAPVPEPINLLKLDEDVMEVIRENYCYESDYEKQLDLVAELAARLDVERTKLEFMAAPLKEAYRLLDAEARKTDRPQFFDVHLKRELGRIQREHRYPKRPTGAKPWEELAKTGATDQQILKNIRSIELSATNKSYYLDKYGYGDDRPIDFCYRNRGNDAAGRANAEVKLITGTKNLIAHARRVMGVGQPAKAAKKSTGKKPATKKKSSKPAAAAGKNKPASGGRKSSSKKKSSKPATKPGVITSSSSAPAIAEAQQQATPAAAAGNTLDLLRQFGPSTTATFADRLGISRDAAGARLRRLVNQGDARRNGDEFAAVGPTTPAKASSGGKAPDELQQKWDQQDAAIDAKFAEAKAKEDNDAYNMIALRGPLKPTQLSSALSISLQATLERVSRLTAAGRVKLKRGKLDVVPAPDGDPAAADAALNEGFDDSIDAPATPLKGWADDVLGSGGGTATATRPAVGKKAK